MDDRKGKIQNGGKLNMVCKKIEWNNRGRSRRRLVEGLESQVTQQEC